MCVLSLQLLSDTVLILRRNELYMITNVHRSSCEVPVILVIFSNNARISSFMEIRPIEAELFHAGRQTDKRGTNDERNSRFSQCAPDTLLNCRQALSLT
jgi:hypothetical protein